MSEVAVVAGGSAGVGRAAVNAFARRGYRVAVLARDPERVERACADVRAAGGHALAIALDVADANQVEQAAARIERELGPIAVWVNNASTTVFARALDTTAEEYERLTMVQLSAFNTPQFDWARSKLPRRLQPVPPIFQPEIAAEAIVWAATHSRREWWVGWPAVKTILATRLLPGGLGDRMAARNAYDAQQTSEPADASRADNLFAPVPGNFGAHGRFDKRAVPRSLAWLLSKYR
jgi:hypothetical protein